MALFEILTPESVSETSDFTKNLLEASERRKAQANAFQNKFQNQNSEYDAAIKANNDLLKGSGEANESIFSSWSSFFKKIESFLTGDNSEYRNFYDKVKEQKPQNSTASNLSVKSSDTAETAALKAQINETLARGQQMINADLQGMFKQTTSFIPSTSTHTSVTKTSASDSSSKGGDEYSFSKMMGKRMVESIKSTDFGMNTAYYEGRSERAKSSYENAIKKMGDTNNSAYDARFWKNTADTALKDMEYYGNKAAESKARDKAGL